MLKKKIKIHKRNEIIRGSDDFSLNAKRAMNAIYFLMQKNRNLGVFGEKSITIPFVSLRKLMNLEKDGAYIEVMKDALNELMRPIQLNNYYHPIKKIKYDWFATTFLTSAGFRKKENGEWVADISVSELMKHLMSLPAKKLTDVANEEEKNLIGQGFTELELIPYLNKFRTKYAMKIYEYLKSFGAYRYLDITQKHLMKLLNLENSKTYKYYGDLSRLLERQLNEIVKKTDLKEVKLIKSKALSKEKTFRIIINPKSKKDVEKTVAKTALENLIKRF